MKSVVFLISMNFANSAFAATVGVGGDYSTIEDALDDGVVDIQLIDSTHIELDRISINSGIRIWSNNLNSAPADKETTK